MKKMKKAAALTGASIILGGLLAVSASGAALAAGADPGTIGSGRVVTPSSSPYITWVYVDECITRGGQPDSAVGWQGKAELDDLVAYGPKHTVGDGHSTVSLRKNGTYSGSWSCLKLY